MVSGTRAAAVVDLVRGVVKDHDQTSGDRVTVIPVLIDDLDDCIDLVRGTSTLLDALWIDAESLARAVPRPTDDRRLGQWNQPLREDVPGSTRLIVLKDDGEDWEPEFHPPSGGGASPGEQSFLKVVRAAAHGHLDTRSIAFIVYRDSLLDVWYRRTAWRVTVDRFFNVPHAVLRTLVVVVEASIDIPRHCQTGTGFRYAIDSSKLVRRRGEADLKASARAIANSPRPFVLFLGAGFSVSSRLPLGNSLRDSAIQRLIDVGGATLTSEELASRFYAWIRDRQGLMSPAEREQTESEYVHRLTLEQVVRAEIGFTGSSLTLQEFKVHHDSIVDSPGPAVVDLCHILDEGSLRNKIVLSGVNFDELVERNLSTDTLRVFADDDEFADAPSYLDDYFSGKEDRVPYLKLHGTISRFETCVASAAQTELGVGQAKSDALRSLLADTGRLWLYVGASMRDMDLLPLISDEAFARGLDERWVAPYLVDTVEEFAVRRIPYWRNTEFETAFDRTITETADAFLAAFRAAITSS